MARKNPEEKGVGAVKGVRPCGRKGCYEPKEKG